jgi:outer membrane efflux protein
LKKLGLLAAALLICSQSYGATLDELIVQLEQNGYSTKYRVLEQKQISIDNKKIERIDRDGIDLNGSGKFTDDMNGERSSGLVSASYDFLKYEGEYDEEYNGENKQLLGLEKNFKDIFYGDRKYNRNLFTMDEVIRLNFEDQRMEGEIISLIDTYKTLMDTRLELKLKKGLLPSLEADAVKLERGFDTGQSSKLDYKYSKMRLKNLNNDIGQLNLDLIQIEKTFETVFNLKIYSEIKYTRLKKLYTSDINNIGDRSLENIDLSIEKAEENKKYSAYDTNWPDINAGTFYDVKNDGWLVRLSIDKTLFEYDNTTATYEVEKERLEMEKQRLEKSLENLKNEYFNRYNFLVKEIANLKLQKEVDEMTYKMYKLNYEQGNETYINYIEKYEDYIINSIELEKKENELTAFIYEIQYRR